MMEMVVANSENHMKLK